MKGFRPGEYWRALLLPSLPLSPFHASAFFALLLSWVSTSKGATRLHASPVVTTLPAACYGHRFQTLSSFFIFRTCIFHRELLLFLFLPPRDVLFAVAADDAPPFSSSISPLNSRLVP